MRHEAVGKRQKKANFSDKENSVLVTEVGKRYHILTQSGKTGAVCKKKRQAWKEVTDAVNAVGGYGRKEASIVKRWKDLRDGVKNKRKLANMTGGAPPPPVPFEDQILEVLGVSAATINGIVSEQAGDTFAMAADAEGTPSESGDVKVYTVSDISDKQKAMTADLSTVSVYPTQDPEATNRMSLTHVGEEDNIFLSGGYDVTILPAPVSVTSKSKITSRSLKPYVDSTHSASATPTASAKPQHSGVTCNLPSLKPALGSNFKSNINDDLLRQYLESKIETHAVIRENLRDQMETRMLIREHIISNLEVNELKKEKLRREIEKMGGLKF